MNYGQTATSFPTLNELAFAAERAQRTALEELLRKVAHGEGLKFQDLAERYLPREDGGDTVTRVRTCAAQTTKKTRCTRAARASSDYCKAHQKKIDEEAQANSHTPPTHE